MIEVEGKYGKAKVFADLVDDNALAQVKDLLNQDYAKDAHVRIMPDVHAGMGCTIGTTMKVVDNIVCPNLVGVDIGCGMLTIKLKDDELTDFNIADRHIRKVIPTGFNVNKDKRDRYGDHEKLKFIAPVYEKRDDRSLGTLGGGNHFIEIGEGKKGDRHLIIHSGSRNLGHKVASYYQKLAEKENKAYKHQKRKEIERKFKGNENRERRIEALEALDEERNYPGSLIPLFGKSAKNYMKDMESATKFASLNRKVMAQNILGGPEAYSNDFWKDREYFETIHNYIEDDILRKGAVRAKEGELILIPFNMRDGCLLVKGKGNRDWNESAPHGAGRLMSRRQAHGELCMNEFKSEMKDVHTTSVTKKTLDEAPMAYKPVENIISQMGDTGEIIDVLKPLYNFKDTN